jgi:non-specific serine/threonine protein kinase
VALEGVAALAAASARGQPQSALAIRLLGAAARLREGTTIAPRHEAAERLLAEARAASGGQPADELLAEGRALAPDQVVVLARSALGERADDPAGAGESGAGLTRREREVAALLGRGCSNREIAGALVVSERTAEMHVSNILSKLGLSSRAQAAVWAVEAGLAG